MTCANSDRKPGRDIHVDALRGLMLVVMTMDHFPSLFFDYTHESLGYVSAAEGFIFLSGLVAGRVYSRYSIVDNRGFLWRRALTRAGFIYSTHILTFLILFCLAVLFSVKTWGLETWTPLFYEHPVSALFLGITLTYRPDFLHILPMYVIFILTVPIAIQLAKNNRLWLILLCSTLVWLLAQFGLSERLNAILSKFWPIYFGRFDILSWQLIFVLGVYIGIRGTTDFIPLRFRRPALIVCLLIAIILFSIRYGLILSKSQFEIESLSLVGNLGPIRLLNFIVIALLTQHALSWTTENLIIKTLALLGRHSLEVFTFHIFLLYLFFGIFRTSQFKEVWVLLFVSSLYLPACLLERYQNPWKTWFYCLVSRNHC